MDETTKNVKKSEAKWPVLTEDSIFSLRTTASWTRAIAIIYFVIAGVMFAIAGGAGGVIGNLMEFNRLYSPYTLFDSTFKGASITYSVTIFIWAALYLASGLFLIMFSMKAKKAMRNSDSLELAASLRKMKTYWIYTGIIAIARILFLIPSVIIIVTTLALII